MTPVSHARTDLKNILSDCIAHVQVAIDAFNNSAVSDADTLTALQTAGSYCVTKSSALPSFIGPYGQFFAAKSAESLSDGGASLANASIVSPGAFQFYGMLQSVGPFNLNARLNLIIEAILQWKVDVDKQENSEATSGSGPEMSGNTYRDSIVLT